jgi:hypothetical protein
MGVKGTKLHNTWVGMRHRCNNTLDKAYKYYGALDIKVAPEWETFTGFLLDMKDSWRPGLELDRIDTTRGYYKENCRWVSHTDNMRNSARAKLTVRHATLIKGLLASIRPGTSINKAFTCIAKVFNVDRMTVMDISIGRTWQDVTI